MLCVIFSRISSYNYLFLWSGAENKERRGKKRGERGSKVMGEAGKQKKGKTEGREGQTDRQTDGQKNSAS